MAVVGGTVSVISGGKFANGAVSGAFVHMFNNYSGYDNSVEGQNQRIKDYSAEYPEFVKFIDEGINILDIAIIAVSGAATSVVKAIIFDKVVNPYTLTAIGVAGAGRNVKMSFVANAAGVRAPAQKAWHDLTNVQISNPYTNPAANPAYF